MDQRRVGLDHALAVDGRRQRLVIDLDQLGAVLGLVARVRDHGADPFAGVARHADGERVPAHVGQIQAMK